MANCVRTAGHLAAAGRGDGGHRQGSVGRSQVRGGVARWALGRIDLGLRAVAMAGRGGSLGMGRFPHEIGLS